MAHSDEARVANPVDALSAQLCCLLERQIAAVRAGQFQQVDAQAEQADSLVAKLALLTAGTPSRLASKRRQLERLYDELTLALKAERADVCSQLKKLRHVKRAVGAYRGGTGRQ